jgi:hypothetical protein
MLNLCAVEPGTVNAAGAYLVTRGKISVDRCWLRLLVREPQRDGLAMKDFPHASFPPDTIKLMKEAMEAAVDTLPVPVRSGHIQSIAETILRTAKEGERDPTTLQRMALLELQLKPRE